MTTFKGSAPTIGEQVMTSDGQELGKVKEVMGDCFKVDVRMQPDYWLSTDTIARADNGMVTLRYTKGGLGDVKQEGPDHKGFHPHP